MYKRQVKTSLLTPRPPRRLASVRKTDGRSDLRLPADSVTRIIGDLHLGDGGVNDGFLGMDRLLLDYLRRCESGCDALVLLGDIVDPQQALSLRRIQRAHGGCLRALRRLARRTRLVVVLGNHDWDVDYARLLPGVEVCRRLALGDATMMHGHQLDRYCNPGRRFHRLKVTLHNLAERCFGFQFRVPLRDHDTWQNRIAHWLGAQYGFHLRRMAAVHRSLGQRARAEECEAFIHYWSRSLWGDPHALFEPVTGLLDAHDCASLVCGHTHLPGVVPLQGGCYVNTGSWTFGQAHAATWDGGRFVVEDVATGASLGDRHYRWMREGREPGDFFTWWAENYRGWLRFRSDR